jgi:phenylacetate-CoA ligase
VIYQGLAKKALLPVLDLCRGRNVAEYWKILESNQWLKRENLADLQQRKIRALLKHAYENVPYYHRVFKERGLNPNDIGTLEDLKKVPILKKARISATPQELTARNVSQREIIACYTSGTTAAPLKFYRTKEDISWGTAAWLRAYSWGTYELGDRHAVISAFETSELKNPFLRIINLLQRQNVLLNAYNVSEMSIRASARRMQRLQPQFLMGYSWGMYMLANYLLTEGIRPPKPEAIFTTAETLLPSRRKVIEKAFGCEVYDLYGSSEFSIMASECEKHSGYHIQSENVVLEFVKDGEQVGPSETGAILVTGLHNYAMPFIRYDIGDTGKISEDTCPCGRGLPLFKSLEGRNYEFFVTGDGSILYLRDLDIVFEGFPVKMFQIVQRKLDEIRINIVTNDGYSEKDTNFIKRNIVWKPRETTKIEVKTVKSIPSERSGKKRYLINKMPLYDWLDRTQEPQ